MKSCFDFIHGRRVWHYALLWSAFIGSVYGQTISVFDGATPAGVAPGTPAGSYALSSFEHYNPFSGGFAPVLPLYHVGGRGEAGVDLVWNFQPNWAAYKQFANASVFVGIGPYPSNNIMGAPNAVGLGSAGVVYARTGAAYVNCGMYYPSTPATTVTRLVFLTGSGTEINLTDQTTNGASYTINPPCSTGWSTMDAGRSTLFRSTDGSQLQFTADTPVLETNPNGITHGSATVSGLLQFPNGVTYRIDNSTVSWIRDRNGNKTTLTYNGPSVFVNWFFSVPALTQIVDANNRAVSLNYNDSSCGGCATITYPGTGGAGRVIQINTTNLGSTTTLGPALRGGYGLQTFDQLFPGAGQSTTSYNPTVAQAVQFPDGSQFSFQYNSYGELARVTLPTGGAVEYDYGDGSNGASSGFQGSATDGNEILVYRRLQERREYVTGGSASNYNARTHYTVSYPGAAAADTQMTYDPSGKLVAKTVHTYSGSPLDALTATGTGCNAANEGLETKTEYGAPNPLRTVVNTWAPQSGCQNNPQLQTQTTTLNDTNQVSQVAFSYDGYGNVNDKLESDWNVGTPGNTLRETSTVYYWAKDAHYAPPFSNLVQLPYYSILYDGSKKEQARTIYNYDEKATQAEPTAIVNHDDANFGTGFNWRGNLTSLWRSYPDPNAYVGTSLTYDVAGNVLSVTDANNHQTTFSYADPQNTYAQTTASTNALKQATSRQYDYSSGQLGKTVDLNSVLTTYSYTDPSTGLPDALDRVRAVASAASTTIETRAMWAYPNTRQVVQHQDQITTGDGALQSQTIFDGFGRSIESDTFENASQYIATTTTYNALGGVATRSNPSRPGDGLTAYLYDSLGHATQVTTPDGAMTNVSYVGNQTTVTDPAGKARLCMCTYDCVN